MIHSKQNTQSIRRKRTTSYQNKL